MQRFKGRIEVSKEGLIVKIPLYQYPGSDEWANHIKHFNIKSFNKAFNYLKDKGGTDVTSSELIEEVLHEADDYGIRHEVIDLAMKLQTKTNIDRVDAYIKALYIYLHKSKDLNNE